MHVHTQLRGGDTVCAEERSPPRRLGVDNGRISDFDAAPVVAAPQLLREWAAPTGTAPPSAVSRPEPTLTARGGRRG